MTVSSGAVLAYTSRIKSAESTTVEDYQREIEEAKRRGVKKIEFGAPD